MNALPVVQRELRVAARQPRTYYLRLVPAALAVAVLGYLGFWARTLGFGRGGGEVFEPLVFLADRVSLLAGVMLTHDALSRERREGTLGFLFLSHLNGWDVVLGKLAAHALHAFYALLATMPVLALPLLAGGVTPGRFWWAMLALANTLFFAASLGLLISSAASDARRAQGAATSLALLYWLGPSVLGPLALRLGWPDWWARLFTELSPLTALDATTGRGVSAGRALLFTHLQGWLFLAGAAWLTVRAWHERPAGRTRLRWQTWWRDLTLGRPAARAARRRALLDRNPFLWLIARQRWKPYLVLMLPALVAAFIGLAWWVEGGGDPPWDLALLLGPALHLLLKFWVAGEAAAALVTHRRQGAFELLLSTPLTVQDILRGQFQAWRRVFGPALVTTSLLTVGIPLLAVLSPDWDREDQVWLLTITVAATAGLWADAYTLVWLASWRALAARRYHHAAGSAVFRVLVIPWLILLLLLPTGQGPLGLLFLWAVIGFLSDSLWTVYARNRLLGDFRAAAAGTLSRAPGTGTPVAANAPAAS